MLILIMFFSLIGVLFSGYLSFGQLINGTCPLGGGCPFLWGYPVCFYGLVMFTLLFLTSIVLYFKKDDPVDEKFLLYTSAVGVLFSLYFSIKEIFFLPYPAYWPLLLPTCVYGLVMYIIIFYLAGRMNGCFICKR